MVLLSLWGQPIYHPVDTKPLSRRERCSKWEFDKDIMKMMFPLYLICTHPAPASWQKDFLRVHIELLVSCRNKSWKSTFRHTHALYPKNVQDLHLLNVLYICVSLKFLLSFSIYSFPKGQWLEVRFWLLLFPSQKPPLVSRFCSCTSMNVLVNQQKVPNFSQLWHNNTFPFIMCAHIYFQYLHSTYPF